MLAVAALVGCAKEETLTFDKGEEIGFSSFVDNATRAASATDPSYSTNGQDGYTQLTQFNVYGAVGDVNIFNGNVVSKGTAGYNSPWTVVDGTTQYWIAGANYKFVGVVDGSIDSVTAITPDAAGLPASISYTSNGATDLLCDVVTVNNATAPYDLVAFNYTHLLSKVKFSVKNTSNAANYRFVLTSAKLTNAYESGVYDVTAEAWDVNEMAGSKEFALDLLTINSAATQCHNTELLLLPGASVGVYVEAEIQATDDDGTTWKKVSEVKKTFSDVVTLAQATAYNFVVELGVGAEIQFTATTLPDWGNGNTTDTDGDSVEDAIVK